MLTPHQPSSKCLLHKYVYLLYKCLCDYFFILKLVYMSKHEVDCSVTYGVCISISGGVSTGLNSYHNNATLKSTILPLYTV